MIHPAPQIECVSQLTGALDRLRASGADRSVRATEGIAAACALLSDPESELAHEAAEAARVTGVGEAMWGEAVKNFFSRITAQQLENWRTSESLPEQGRPRLVFHLLAGNLFLSGIESMMLAQLIGSASFVRCSRDDRFFPLIWKKAVGAVDAAAGDAIEVMYWPRSHTQITRAAIDASDAVVAFGHDNTIAALRDLAPASTPFVGHGSRISFLVLDLTSAESLEDLAAAAAYDFTVYEQQGCLSPRAAFLKAPNFNAAVRFARLLRKEMIHLAQTLPPTYSLEQAAALARERDETLIASISTEGHAVVSEVGDSFLIQLRPADGYRPGLANRNCDLRFVSDWAEAARALQPYVSRIATIGSNVQLRTLTSMAPSARYCEPGQMQIPDFGWTHDGKISVHDLFGR